YLFAASIPAEAFYMLDAYSGQVLWTFPCYWPGGIIPLTADLDGLVYLTVSDKHQPGGRALTLLLDPRTRQILRSTPRQSGTLNALIEPDYSLLHTVLPLTLKN
ncbi:MAG: hypothetical protein LLG44_11820, partial [Chloroflexi bacterium]|nr:hypothetical protein [Chloroflexota bacterium]